MYIVSIINFIFLANCHCVGYPSPVLPGLMRVSIYLISILGRVILGTNNQTEALSGSPKNHFNYVNHFLFVGQGPVDFVVVSSAQINHDVTIPKKEHSGAIVIKLIHLVKVLHLVYVHHVKNSEVFNLGI